MGSEDVVTVAVQSVVEILEPKVPSLHCLILGRGKQVATNVRVVLQGPMCTGVAGPPAPQKAIVRIGTSSHAVKLRVVDFRTESHYNGVELRGGFLREVIGTKQVQIKGDMGSRSWVFGIVASFAGGPFEAKVNPGVAIRVPSLLLLITHKLVVLAISKEPLKGPSIERASIARIQKEIETHGLVRTI